MWIATLEDQSGAVIDSLFGDTREKVLEEVTNEWLSVEATHWNIGYSVVIYHRHPPIPPSILGQTTLEDIIPISTADK